MPLTMTASRGYLRPLAKEAAAWARRSGIATEEGPIVVVPFCELARADGRHVLAGCLLFIDGEEVNQWI